MKISEIIFLLVMLGGMLLPSLLFKQWWLFYTFLVFGVIFGLMEWLAVSKTGKSVSQHFWVFSQEHPIKAGIILISMLISWVSLLLHLGKDLFKKKKE